MARGIGGIERDGAHLAGQRLTRSDEPLLVPARQDHLGFRHQVERLHHGQADLARTAEQQHPLWPSGQNRIRHLRLYTHFYVTSFGGSQVSHLPNATTGPR